MLNRPSTRTSSEVYAVTGPELRRLLHGKTATERGRIVARLVEQGAVFSDLSPTQIGRLASVNSGSVSVARHRRGTRILARAIRKYGIDAAWAALDTATSPSMQAAE